MTWLRNLRLAVARWLCADLIDALTAAQTSDRAALEATGLSLAETRQVLGEIATELNRVRNQQSENPPSEQRSVRRSFRSWRETVAAIEGRSLPDSPQPIPISVRRA